MNKYIITLSIIFCSFSAIAWMGYDNQKAMKVCQETHSYDYCFRQIMR